jgi:cell division protein FtsL
MFFSFKNFLKVLVFLLSVLLLVLIVSGISYYAINKTQIKNNLMDIEEYSPISTLRVSENPIKNSKYPFIDVHSHHWNMAVQDLWSC